MLRCLFLTEGEGDAYADAEVTDGASAVILPGIISLKTALEETIATEEAEAAEAALQEDVGCADEAELDAEAGAEVDILNLAGASVAAYIEIG